MWIFLLHIVYVVMGAAVGLVLGLLAKDWVKKSKRGRAVAFSALAFMGMFNFIPPETTTISEPSDEMKVKKGNKSGGPPEPD